jgi:hypothetical protein
MKILKLYKHLIIISVFTFNLFTTSAQSENTGPLGFGNEYFSDELTSDRPDFTESAQTIEAGHYQVESGFTYSYDERLGARTDTSVLPELLLRFGLTEESEFRLFWDGYTAELKKNVSSNFVTHPDQHGASDISIGFKHRLIRNDIVLPDTSFIMELGLPVGSSERTADEVEFTSKLLMEKDLNEDFGLSSNINLASLNGVNERFLNLEGSASISYSISRQVGCYFEYFGLFPIDASEPETSKQYVNGGFTFLTLPNLQLDVRTGVGITNVSDDFFTGVGAVFRN